MSSSGAKRICVGFCDRTQFTTIKSGHIGLWTKMRRSGAQFSGPESSLQIRSLADFITTTSESRFSVHTGAGTPYPANRRGELEGGIRGAWYWLEGAALLIPHPGYHEPHTLRVRATVPSSLPKSRPPTAHSVRVDFQRNPCIRKSGRMSGSSITGESSTPPCLRR
jgi:hypothetical protein